MAMLGHLILLQLLTALFAALATMSWPVDAVVPQTLPIMGLSTWNAFQQNINDTLMRQLADTLVRSNLAAAGYVYVNIDDGWGAQHRNSTGHIVPNPDLFPYGMKNLSDYVHAAGLKFGLYTSRANLTCGQRMPGSLGHEQKDAHTFAAYGADWLKNDDCNVIYSRAFQDYGAMERALEQVSRPILHNVKAPDLNATVAPTVAQFRRVAKDLKNTWQDMVRVLDTGIDAAFQQAAGPADNFWNDFDMLEVGNDQGQEHNIMGSKMTMREWQAHFSLWAALKSPLQIGCDIRQVNQSVLTILLNKDVISVNQDPLGVPVRRVAVFVPTRADNETTKVSLHPCVGHEEPLFERQVWHITNASDGSNIISSDGRCMTIWQCQTRWPWWISVEPCASSRTVRPETALSDTGSARLVARRKGVGSACDEKLSQLWKIQNDRQIVARSLEGCWPGHGGVNGSSQCCLSSAGSNVEVQQCGWPVDGTTQSWTLNSNGQLVSVANGLCATLADNVEVYAGPLTDQHTTVVVFNRTPYSETVTVPFNVTGFQYDTALVRDLLAEKDLGQLSTSLNVTVESHAVRHFSLKPSHT